MTLTLRAANSDKTRTVTVLASVGVWAVHKGIFSDPGYTVTHIPTRHAACCFIRTKTRAIQAMRALHRIPGNWTVTDREALSNRQRIAGKRIRRQFQDLQR